MFVICIVIFRYYLRTAFSSYIALRGDRWYVCFLDRKASFKMIILRLKSEKNSLSYYHFCTNDSILQRLVLYFTLKLDIAGTTENKVIYWVFVVNKVERTWIHRGKFRFSKYVFPMTTDKLFLGQIVREQVSQNTSFVQPKPQKRFDAWIW